MTLLARVAGGRLVYPVFEISLSEDAIAFVVSLFYGGLYGVSLLTAIGLIALGFALRHENGWSSLPRASFIAGALDHGSISVADGSLARDDGCRLLLLRPDGEFIAARIAEMKAPPARKFIRCGADRPAGSKNTCDAGVEVGGVQNDQGSTSSAHLFGDAESADFAPFNGGILDPGITGSVVVERPAEGCAVEPLRSGDIEDRDLDVVDCMMAMCGGLFSHENSVSAATDK